MATQNEAILNWLQQGNTLTPLQAFEKFGTLALHSRAAELRAEGHIIECEKISVNGKRVGRYSLLRVAYG